MKRKFISPEVSVIVLGNVDLLTASGEDDAIVTDRSWSGVSATSNWNS